MSEKNKTEEVFDDMKRKIYVLCEPFREQSRMDAGENVTRNTTVEVDVPEDVKKISLDFARRRKR